METNVYMEPTFEVIRPDESNKVFFTASGSPQPQTTSVGGSLSKMTFSNASW